MNRLFSQDTDATFWFGKMCLTWRGYDLKELVKFLVWIPSINKYPTTPPKGHAHFQVATFHWGTPAYLSTL